MFSPDQMKALEAPLNSSHVKQRKQAGRQLDYIEGWHAIAEANRIFGFDRWTRETVDLRMVAERERQVGERKGWGVTYVAKVRVMVLGGPEPLIREGVGTGHGIDADLGQAHESAVKEAETDAMKRALMTFGNPFGLALYDKTKANVADDPTPQTVTEEDTVAVVAAKAAITMCKSEDDLAQWSANNKAMLDQLSEPEKQSVRAAWAARSKQIKQKEAA